MRRHVDSQFRVLTHQRCRGLTRRTIGNIRRLVGEALQVHERFGDLDLIPDTYFLDTELIAFLNRTVLEHGTVRAEREYDFKRGMVGGTHAPPLDEDESELERIDDASEPSEDEEPDDRDGEHLRTLKL